jgi:arsenite methyltransferase
MQDLLDKHESLREYYGKILKSTKDLKTSACCCADSGHAPRIKEILSDIDDEVINKFYGCGTPFPSALEGCTVLDLGCGTGRDVYVASRLVGPKGFVIGVDMTDEQVEVARRYVHSQTMRAGYSEPNVDFRKGYIENLKEIGINDNSIDVVISNCVINLSPDKESVFLEIFRVLKPGGELYFSDIFSGRKVPEHLKSDPVLHGECLAGAMYIEDFRRLLTKLGYPDYRVISSQPVTLNNPEIEEKIGMVNFYSRVIRVFKLDNLEDICEDYGQIAVYKGTIVEYHHSFPLDDHHIFISGKPMLVCGNTASMLEETRLKSHFTVIGNRNVHYGRFDCAPASVKAEDSNYNFGGACC